MRKTMCIVGGMAALAAVYAGSRLTAQPGQAPAAPPPQTRLAFVNIETVFQGYKKATVYKEEMKKALEPFQAQADKLRKEMIKWETDMRDPKFNPADKERYEQGILANKRQLEDLERQARKLVGKKNEEQVVQLYKEVNEKVKSYAVTQGFHVVLAFSDNPQMDPALTLSYPNIARKVQGMEGSGCVSAMYMAPGLDISGEIVNLLNRSYTPAAGAPGSSTITPAGGTR